MHLFRRHAVADYDAAARLIPVIDYGPYFADAPGAVERVAAEVAHACHNVGFFYVLNHGVPEELIDRAFAASRRFHALPLEQKLALKLNENNIGYLPINASVQGASTVHRRRGRTTRSQTDSATPSGLYETSPKPGTRL